MYILIISVIKLLVFLKSNFKKALDDGKISQMGMHN